MVNSKPVVVNRTTRFSCSKARTYVTLHRRNCRAILIGSGPTAVVASARVTSRICVRPLAIRSMSQVVHRRCPSTVLPALNKRVNLGLTMTLNGANVLSRLGVRVLNAGLTSVSRTRSHRGFGRLVRHLGRPMPTSGAMNAITRTLRFTRRVNCPIVIQPTFAVNNANNNVYRGSSSLGTVTTGNLSLSPTARYLVRGSVTNCGRVRFRMVHSTTSGTVMIYYVRGFSPINVRANSSVIFTPYRALSSHRCRVLHSYTLGLVQTLGVRNNYGIRLTLSPGDCRCGIVRIGPQISHSSTLTSGTANCPVTGVTTGVTIKLALSRVGGPIAKAAFTRFRPTLSCMIYGVPH